MFSKSRLIALVIAADIVVLMISKATLSEQTVVDVDAAYQITNECINCGICYEAYPWAFRQCEQSAAFVNGMPNCETCTNDGSGLQDAMDDCPVEAIVRVPTGKKCECGVTGPCRDPE